MMKRLHAQQPRNRGSILERGVRFSSSPKRRFRLWEPPVLPFSGYAMHFPGDQVSVLMLSGVGGVPRNFFQGGGSTNSVEDRDRENGDLGAVAP